LPWLNQSQPKEQIENIRYAIKRGRPYGSEDWVGNAAAQFGLQTTLRKRGRPGKEIRKGTRRSKKVPGTCEEIEFGAKKVLGTC